MGMETELLLTEMGIIIIIIIIIIIERKRAKRPLTLQYAYTKYTEKTTYKIKLTSHKTVLAFLVAKIIHDRPI